MHMIKINLMSICITLTLPLIILFCIGMVAWHCARAVVNWLTDDL